MFQILGGIGALCFAFCLLPQVIRTYKEKDASGLSWAFLWLSFGGNVASCGYVVYTNYISGVWQFPLYFNYGVALVLCILLMVAKWRFLDLKKITSVKILTNKIDDTLESFKRVSGRIQEFKESYSELKRKLFESKSCCKILKERCAFLDNKNLELTKENFRLKAYLGSKGFSDFEKLVNKKENENDQNRH